MKRFTYESVVPWLVAVLCAATWIGFGIVSRPPQQPSGGSGYSKYAPDGTPDDPGNGEVYGKFGY